MGLSHYDRELLALDTRIHRLARACGLDLASWDDVFAIVKRDFSVCSDGDNLRREELRGLLMLKYKIEEHCIADLGRLDCHRLIEAEEAALKKRGL